MLHNNILPLKSFAMWTAAADKPAKLCQVAKTAAAIAGLTSYQNLVPQLMKLCCLLYHQALSFQT